jgi:hypothetical protein
MLSLFSQAPSVPATSFFRVLTKAIRFLPNHQVLWRVFHFLLILSVFSNRFVAEQAIKPVL